MGKQRGARETRCGAQAREGRRTMPLGQLPDDLGDRLGPGDGHTKPSDRVWMTKYLMLCRVG